MYSFLVAGCTFVFFGVAIGSISMVLLGAVSLGVGGFFRARNVIYGSGVSGDRLKIQGAGINYLKLFPAKSDGEEL